MWDFFLRKQSFTYLLILVLFGFGFYSVNEIPKESAPEVQVPVGIITTILPGASAIDIENLITNEIERGLSGNLENVKKITSTSKTGVSVITVEFEAEADIDESISELRSKVDGLINLLPRDIDKPVVNEVNFVDQPIVTLAISGDKTDYEFTDIANNIINELEKIEGVSRVEKNGIREREINVLIDQTLLLKFNLTVVDVLNGIKIANNNFPVGQIVTDNVSYNIIFSNENDSVEKIESIPIATKDGKSVLVGDVAEVVDGLATADSFSRLSVDNLPSETSFTLNIFKQRGGDITKITDDIQDEISSLNDTVFTDLKIYTIFDAGDDIKNDLSQLTISGLQTIILVIVILMFAIGWREGLIAGLAIPFSFIIGFIGLYLSDNTLNFISLFALILGIGVLVDSGIVIVEGINKKIKDNDSISTLQAAKETLKEFSVPLISGTLTTVAMFVGLFVVSGVTGQFISSIPFTLIFIMFASLFTALGILPLISAKLIKKEKIKNAKEQSGWLSKIENWYKLILTKIIYSRTLKIRFLSFITVGFITAILLVPSGFVKVVFFAQSDVDFVIIEVELPEGSVKESTDLAVRRIEERIYKYTDTVEAFSTTVGAGNAFGSGGSNSKLANIQISLLEERDVTSSKFIEVLRDDLSDIKDVKISINQPTDGPPTGSPIGVKLFGEDLESLTKSANDIAKTLQSIAHVSTISTSANTNTSEFVFELDQEKADQYGLNSQIVAQSLRTAVFGSEATNINTLDEDIEVVVKLNLSTNNTPDPSFSNWTTIDELENLELVNSNGDRIPISALTETKLRESNTIINHEDQKRIINVSADLTSEGNVLEVNTQLEDKIKNELNLPEDISYSLGGEAEESNQAFKELFLALVVGIVLMIAILVLQFNSFRHTIYVLSILPFSLIGILYGLAITNSSLSFPSIMGFIALSGIIVNNSILLIDMMNKSRILNPEKNIYEIVINSSTNRLRPILLTSVTTIVGMIPLLFTDEVWIPLASAVIFGLAFSVIITLVLVPIIYSKWPGKVNDREK